MPELGTSGSVGGPGGNPPGPTRCESWGGGEGERGRGGQGDGERIPVPW
jgi:hypothetical protein